MKIRNKAIPAVYVFLEKDGTILVARRCNTGYQDGNYNVPSGHVEASELPRAAMIREAKEEIGIDLSPENLKLVHVSYRPKHDETGDRVDFFFRATKWSGEVTNMEPNKCDDLKWVKPTQLPASTTPHVREAIESMLSGVMFSELDADWLKSNNVWMLPDEPGEKL
jgi:ADP-ribose pyrophosphatase YjhB (NUDIX family)